MKDNLEEILKTIKNREWEEEKMKNKRLNEKYNPKDFEDELYKEWEQKGYFKPSMDTTNDSYCIMMPPPNVTG